MEEKIRAMEIAETLNCEAGSGRWGVINDGIIILISPYEPYIEKRKNFAFIDAYYYVSHKTYLMQKRIVEKLNKFGIECDIFLSGDLKTLFIENGYAMRGTNTLCYLEDYGSRFYIGCIKMARQCKELISFSKMKKLEKSFTLSCETCGKCIKACPTKAITENGFDYNKCIRTLMLQPHMIDDESSKKMGNKVLGCGICQEVCPANKSELIAPQEKAMQKKLSIKNLLKSCVDGDLGWLKELIGTNIARQGKILPLVVNAAGNSADSTLIKELESIPLSLVDEEIIIRAKNKLISQHAGKNE